MSHETNIERLREVSFALENLRKQVVFVGGATVSLYADRIHFESRPTEDVDVVIELLSYSAWTELEEKLRQLGFKNDIDSKVICRYKLKETTVDIMPTEERLLGFSNRWYPEAFENAVSCSIDDEVEIKIFTAPYFIATKLEAFKNRGKEDGRTSPDFEDIVFILENRRKIWEELAQLNGEVSNYLKQEFSELLKLTYFNEWISAHTDRFGSPPADVFIIPYLKKFVNSI